MNGIIMLFVYAAIMILATVTMTKKEKNVVNFCVGSRSENWILSALSIAATWIWAPALFVSTEKAYSAGWIGLFWISCREQPYPELQWLASGQRNPYKDFRILRP